MVFPIDSDGSLGGELDFGDDGTLGNTDYIGYVRLSPNEKFLYASGNTGSTSQIVTEEFSESPLTISYSGCTTNLRLPPGPGGWSLATAAPTGAGAALYVAESNPSTGGGRVALLGIDASSGCTTEEPSSPFILTDSNSGAVSLVAWPPRPF